ncbi:MAG: FtsX-like permease family protein [Acidimicrobiales bacterium]
MRLGLLELRRRPGRFGVACAVLSLLVVLLLLLGGLLDGLFLGSTGALRAQRADAVVFSASARESLLRSRLTPEDRAVVEAVDGVDAVGGLGVALVAARVPGRSALADAAVIGYELAPRGTPAPPPPGQAYADTRLRADGASLGDTLLVGLAETPITIVGWVEDTSYLLQGALWVAPDTWREVQNRSRPDAALGEGEFQALVVRGGPDPAALAAAVDAAAGGATTTLTKNEAVFSLPGTRQQNSTFLQIIYTTVAVAALVVALFFALITLERSALYGVLKALGASSAQLFAGVLSQAIVVAGVALVVGGAVTWLVAELVPVGAVPLQLEASRALFSAVWVLAAAALGSAVSLRRVVRVDPASAIGTGP